MCMAREQNLKTEHELKTWNKGKMWWQLLLLLFCPSKFHSAGVEEMGCPWGVQLLTPGPRLSPSFLVHSPSHLSHFYQVLKDHLMIPKLVWTDSTPNTGFLFWLPWEENNVTWWPLVVCPSPYWGVRSTPTNPHGERIHEGSFPEAAMFVTAPKRKQVSH